MSTLVADIKKFIDESKVQRAEIEGFAASEEKKVMPMFQLQMNYLCDQLEELQALVDQLELANKE